MLIRKFYTYLSASSNSIFRVGIGLALLLTANLLSCGKKEVNKGPKYTQNLAIAKVPLYTFAIIPSNNPTMLFQTYQPLIADLNDQVKGARFALEASRDYASFEAKISNRKPDVILANPYQTLLSQKVGYHVIAMAGKSKDFKGLFIVRRDGHVNDFKDLVGKAISYPSKTALAGCIMPQLMLYRNGININHDVQNIYVGSQESSIMNVYLKNCAVACTWTKPWYSFLRDHSKEASALKIMWETESLVNNSVMIRNDIPDSIGLQIKQCLLTLSSSKVGRTLLTKTAISCFLPASDKDYYFVKKYIDNFEKKVRKINE